MKRIVHGYKDVWRPVIEWLLLVSLLSHVKTKKKASRPIRLIGKCASITQFYGIIYTVELDFFFVSTCESKHIMDNENLSLLKCLTCSFSHFACVKSRSFDDVLPLNRLPLFSLFYNVTLTIKIEEPMGMKLDQSV